jgi:predicted site-specific integrase-resolvase
MSVRNRTAVQRPKRVFKLKEWCELNGFSYHTGHRLLQSGRGPKITQLSDRRIGIREDHNAEWQDARVRGE